MKVTIVPLTDWWRMQASRLTASRSWRLMKPFEVIDDGNTHALCGNSSKNSIEREGLSDPILMKHSQLVSRVHQSIVD